MRCFILFTEFRSGSTLFRRLIRHFLKEDLYHLKHFKKVQRNGNYFLHANNIKGFNDELSLLVEGDTDLGIIFLSRSR